MEERDLRRSKDTGGNHQLSKHILDYRWPASSDNVAVGMREPPDFTEVRKSGIHTGCNYDLGGWMRPQLSIVLLGIRLACFCRFVDITHRRFPYWLV